MLDIRAMLKRRCFGIERVCRDRYLKELSIEGIGWQGVCVVERVRGGRHAGMAMDGGFNTSLGYGGAQVEGT